MMGGIHDHDSCELGGQNSEMDGDDGGPFGGMSLATVVFFLGTRGPVFGPPGASMRQLRKRRSSPRRAYAGHIGHQVSGFGATCREETFDGCL